MARLIPDGVVQGRRERRPRSRRRSSLHAAGYDAVLVGETLVTAADPRSAIAAAARRVATRTNRSASDADRAGPVPFCSEMFVKICGITNEDDALLAVAMGADAVGFVFAPSPRQIAPQQVYDITRRLPPEILTVGVFRDELPSG